MERPTALNMINTGDGHPQSTNTSSRPNVLQGFLSGGEEQSCVHIQQEKWELAVNSRSTQKYFKKWKCCAFCVSYFCLNINKLIVIKQLFVLLFVCLSRHVARQHVAHKNQYHLPLPKKLRLWSRVEWF